MPHRKATGSTPPVVVAVQVMEEALEAPEHDTAKASALAIAGATERSGSVPKRDARVNRENMIQMRLPDNGKLSSLGL